MCFGSVYLWQSIERCRGDMFYGPKGKQNRNTRAKYIFTIRVWRNAHRSGKQLWKEKNKLSLSVCKAHERNVQTLRHPTHISLRLLRAPQENSNIREWKNETTHVSAIRRLSVALYIYFIRIVLSKYTRMFDIMHNAENGNTHTCCTSINWQRI